MDSQELKNEILATRKGGFGSSDAKMVATVGKTGLINESAKLRIAEMLGIEEPKEFTSIYTENGRRREEQIIKHLTENFYPSDFKGSFASNPYNELPVTPYSFKVFNHIDLEVITNYAVIWYEIKTSKSSTSQVFEEYKEQLAWHYMILNEKCFGLKKDAVLTLVHYAEDYENLTDELDTNKLFFHQITPTSFTDKGAKANSDVVGGVLELKGIEQDIDKGLMLINNEISTFAENYKKREELVATDLPMPLQEKLSVIHSFLCKIDEMQEQVDDFKQKLLTVMEENNVKKITTDYFSITYIAPTIKTSFDSKALEKADKDLYKQYLRQSNVKSSIRISDK